MPRWSALLAAIILPCIALVGFDLTDPTAAPPHASTTAASASLRTQPLLFDDASGAWRGQGPGYQVEVAASGGLRLGGDRPATIGLRWVGGAPAPRLVAEDRVRAVANYLIGDRSQWRLGVARHGRIRASGMYPGIDVVYKGTGSALEFDVVVAPGSDPARARFSVDGADRLDLEPATGDLLVGLGQGHLRKRAPIAFQERGGQREMVPVRFALDGDQIGFELGAYDPALPLTIDPIIAYQSYFGTAGNDFIRAIAAGSDRSVVVCGGTPRSDFPVRNAYQPALADVPASANYEGDAFVSRIDTVSGEVLWSTYLGGASEDGAFAVHVAADGTITVAGSTMSTNFPTTAGAHQTTLRGSKDGFVAKLDRNGAALLASTLYGGTFVGSTANQQRGENNDLFEAIAVDSAGSVYAVGNTRSSDLVLANGHKTGALNGSDSFDGMLVRFSASLGSVLYATRIGGSGTYENIDLMTAVACNDTGSAWVAGRVWSPDLPTTLGAYKTAKGTGVLDTDAVVARYDTTQAGAFSLAWMTYVGGSGREFFPSTVDPMTKGKVSLGLLGDGRVAIAGLTIDSGYPTTAGAFDTGAGVSGVQQQHPVLSVLAANGGSLSFSTYLSNGGVVDSQGNGEIQALAVRGTDIHLAGWTSSPTFPQVNPAVALPGVGNLSGIGADAVLIRVALAGTPQLVSSMRLGGSHDETACALAVDPSGTAYLAGWTYSTDLRTILATQPAYRGGQTDGFIAAVLPTLPTRPLISVSGGGVVVFGAGSPIPPSNGRTLYVTRTASDLSQPLTVDVAIGRSPSALTVSGGTGTHLTVLPAPTVTGSSATVSVTIPANQAFTPFTVAANASPPVAWTTGFSVAAAAGYDVSAYDRTEVTFRANNGTARSVSIDALGDAQESGKDGRFLISLVGQLSGSFDLDLTVGGSALRTTDYRIYRIYEGVETEVTGSTLTFPGTTPTVDRMLIAIRPIQDAIVEGAESVTLAIASSNPNVVINQLRSSAQIAIQDDDASLSLPVVSVARIADASEQGLVAGRFRVTRTQSDLSAPLTVSLLRQGTATAGSDYAAPASSVTIPAAAASADVVITPLADALSEGAESVVLRLVESVSTYTIGDGVASLSIFDANDPVGTVTITVQVVGSGSVTLNPPGGTYPVGTVVTATATPGAGAAFLHWSNAASGSDSPVALVADATKTLVATFASAASLPTVSLSAASGTAGEPSAPASVTVTRTGATTLPLAIYYAIAGSAANGADYSALSGTVVIPAGAASAQITVQPIDDAIAEGSETVTLTLQTSGQYLIGSGSPATVTITDNDAAGGAVVTLSAPSGSAAEPGTPATVTVTRTGSTTAPLTVAYTVAGSATAGTDYAALSGSATIPAGSASTVITVQPIDDALVEGAETVIITLGGGGGYTLGGTIAATVTIADNDTAPINPLSSLTVVLKGPAPATAAMVRVNGAPATLTANAGIQRWTATVLITGASTPVTLEIVAPDNSVKTRTFTITRP